MFLSHPRGAAGPAKCWVQKGSARSSRLLAATSKGLLVPGGPSSPRCAHVCWASSSCPPVLMLSTLPSLLRMRGSCPKSMASPFQPGHLLLLLGLESSTGRSSRCLHRISKCYFFICNFCSCHLSPIWPLSRLQPPMSLQSMGEKNTNRSPEIIPELTRCGR